MEGEKDRKQLINELKELRQKIEEFEKSKIVQKRIEAALRESEEAFRLTFEDAKDAIFWADPETGFITNCNRAAEKLLGKDRKEIIGKKQTEIHPPAKADYYADMFRRHIDERGALKEKAEIITASGEIRPVHITASVSMIGGRPIIQGIFRDITEWEKAQVALRESEEKFKALFDSASDAVFIHDLQGNFMEVNNTACERLGYSKEELLQMTPMEIDSSEYGHLVQNRIEEVKNKGHRFFETEHVTKDGKVIPIELSSRVIEFQSKPAILSVARDITQRKEAERALRESEEKYRMLFDCGNDAIFVHEITEEGLPGCFVEVNKIAYEKLGYSKEELMKQSPLDLNPNRDMGKVRKFIDKLLVDKHALIENSLYTKDGKEINFEINANVFELQGRPVVLAIGRDITERKLTERELELHKSYFQQLFEDSPNAIVMLDYHDRVILANKGFQELFQYKSEEIKDQHINELIVPEDLTEEASGYSQQALGGGVVRAEGVRKRKDGTLVEVAILGYPIVVDSKQIGVYGIYTDISEQKQAEKKLKESYDRLHKVLDGTVIALASTTEKRDPYIAGHQERVTKLACEIAKEMNLSEQQIEGIRVAGLLHDIGKIHVAAEILNKPVKLNDIEMRLVRTHPTVGYEILKSVEFSWPVAKVVLQHHERIDGSGYPQGIKGKDILLEARILGVADVVEAMSSRRPYRPAHAVEKALDEIEKNRGTSYDPDVVDVCVKLFKEKGFKLD